MMNSLFKKQRGRGVLSLFFTQRLIPHKPLSVFGSRQHAVLGSRMMNSLFKSQWGERVLSLFFTQRLIPKKYLSVFGCRQYAGKFKTACCLGTA